jgi:hypothetical protein
MWQYWSHFKYIMIHKWYVFLECRKKGILWRGIVHDLSKFRPSEFIAYSNYFFNTDGTRKDPMSNYSRQKEAFKRAWCCHQNRNDHHPFYWTTGTHNSSGGNNSVEAVFPDVWALKETAADMIGASAAQGNSDPLQGAKDYYLKHKDNIILHPLARSILEIELGVEKGEVEITGERWRLKRWIKTT